MTSLTYESIIKILCTPKFAAGGGIPRDSTCMQNRYLDTQVSLQFEKCPNAGSLPNLLPFVISFTTFLLHCSNPVESVHCSAETGVTLLCLALVFSDRQTAGRRISLHWLYRSLVPPYLQVLSCDAALHRSRRCRPVLGRGCTLWTTKFVYPLLTSC